MAGAGWTKEAVCVLLDEYQKNPCLYEVKMPLYHNRNARREAENKIAAVVSVIRTNTNSVEVKAKINGLRTQFCSERNKLAKCLHSGMGTDAVYKPSFTWYERMMFLVPHITSRSSKSNLDESLSDVCEVIQLDTDQLWDESGVLAVHEEGEPQPSPPAEASLVETDLLQEQQQFGSVGSTKRKRKTSLEDDVLSRASQLLESVAASSSSDNSPDDEFGRFIATELKSMPMGRIKLRLKHNIQKLVMESQMELLGNE